MLRHRVILIAAVGTALFLPVANAFGKPIVVHRSHGRAGVTTRRHGQVVVRRNHSRPSITTRRHSQVVVRRPHFPRIISKRPYHTILVIKTPYGRRIKAFQTPRYRVTPHYGMVRRPIVIVRITNSDGSRTAVELLRRGRGFVGPRGEWYPEMPTKRRLWFAYGF